MKIKEAYPYTKAAIKRFAKMYPAPMKVLDVGTRDGYSLHCFNRYGYDAAGIEIEQEYVDFCKSRGYDVEQDDFECTKVSDTYDAVYSSHVIEHCHDPLNFLKSAYKVLRPEGILFMYFPLEHFRKKHKNKGRDDAMKHRQFWPTLDDFRNTVLSRCAFFTEVDFFITRTWGGHTEALFIGEKCSL